MKKKAYCRSSIIQVRTLKSQSEVIKLEINQEKSISKCETVTIIPDENYTASDESQVSELEAINLLEVVNQVYTEVSELVDEIQPEATGKSSSLTTSEAISASS